MASADLRDELTCSICLNIFTDPVTLTCGHSFCRTCIENVPGPSEKPGASECPKCKAEFEECPTLEKRRKLSNIAETFQSSNPEQEDVGILCTYCDSPAVKTCLLCEMSLCEKHVKKHSKSEEHVLIEPTASLENRKCPIHKKVLEYYCSEDATSVCVSCCLIGEHRGHQMESLHEASEKIKEKMQNKLKKLISEKSEKEKKIQSLQDENRDEEDMIPDLTAKTTALFMGIREQLETLEKRVLSQINRYGDKSSYKMNLHEINQLEIKMEDLSRKVGHIEGLCNTPDPLTILQVWESDGEDDEDVDENDEGEIDEDDDVKDDGDDDEEDEADDEHNEDDDEDNKDDDEEDEADDEHNEDDDEDDDESSVIMTSANEEYGLVFATLHTGLDEVVTWAKRQCNAGHAEKYLNVDITSNILLDINSAGNNTAISGDGKAMTFSKIHQKRPAGPERFKISQVLSTTGFSSGIHYWEVEVSPTGGWRVGVTYPSIDREGVSATIGNNNKSWALDMDTFEQYMAIHDNQRVILPGYSSCDRIGIFLGYESGQLSFYELGNPIRHLHTFTSSFNEPLHIAIFAYVDPCWVRMRR